LFADPQNLSSQSLRFGIKCRHDVEIPFHLQQQFASVIHELQDAIGREATQAYLKFLSSAVESTDSASMVNSRRNTHDLDTQCSATENSETAEEKWMTS